MTSKEEQHPGSNLGWQTESNAPLTFQRVHSKVQMALETAHVCNDIAKLVRVGIAGISPGEPNGPQTIGVQLENAWTFSPG